MPSAYAFSSADPPSTPATTSAKLNRSRRSSAPPSISFAIVPRTGPAMRVNTTRCGSSSVMRSVKRCPRNSMSRSNSLSLCRATTSQNVIAGTNGSALFAFLTRPSQTAERSRWGCPAALTGSWCDT